MTAGLVASLWPFAFQVSQIEENMAENGETRRSLSKRLQQNKEAGESFTDSKLYWKWFEPTHSLVTGCQRTLQLLCEVSWQCLCSCCCCCCSDNMVLLSRAIRGRRQFALLV